MTKIVPYSFGLEEDMEENRDTRIGIEKMSITYTQPADTCSSGDEIQFITLTTNCGCAPGKEEAEKKECFYFDITIPEGCHWSVMKPEELALLIKDFENRIYMITKDNEQTDNS